MKTTKLLKSLLLVALFTPFLTSCENNEPSDTVAEINVGMYILNQGSYGKNNASLSYFNFTDSLVTSDVFTQKNNRGLGDTGQDFIKYGSKLYIAMYKSSLIDIVDAATGVSLKQIPMVDAANGNAPRKPRCLTSFNGKVYVSLFDGHVAKIDTTSLSVDGLLAVGSNPEGIVAANNKIYVANSGGMSAKADSTISVIDPATFTVTKNIKVVINPVVLKADKYGDLYVISMGNYTSIPYTLQRVDATTQSVTKISDVKAYNLTIYGDRAYIYNYEYDATYTPINKSYTVYDVKNEKILSNAFINSSLIANLPYSIDVNPVTEDVYIGETDYMNNGKMNCFSKDGKLKFTFSTGINPVKCLFVTK